MAWVYVFRNIDQRFAGLYKIGHTTRVDPETRAREISTRTGVIGKYIVEGVYEVDSSDTVEREVHRLLRAKRYQNNREFFRASLAEIDAAIHEAVENVGDYLYDGTQPVVTEEEREEEEHRRDCRKREAERKSQERMAEAEQRAQKLKAEAAAQEAQQEKLKALARDRLSLLPESEGDAILVLRYRDEIIRGERIKAVRNIIWSFVKLVGVILGFLTLSGEYGQGMAVFSWVAVGFFIWHEWAKGKPSKGSDEYYHSKVAKERARNSAQAKARFIDNQSNIANWLLFGALAVFLAAAVVWSWDNRFRLKSTDPKAAEWRFFRHYSGEEASIAQGYFVTPRAARSIYYDPKSIKKTNGGAEILVLEDLETPDTLHATTPHLSIKALTEYKCGDMHERTHVYRQYSQNMAHGQVVFQDRFDSNWFVIRGKPDEDLFDFTCSTVLKPPTTGISIKSSWP